MQILVRRLPFSVNVMVNLSIGVVSMVPIIPYLLLTEFEVRTVSYGPSFSPFPVISEVNRRVGKETSQSEAEGSTATTNAVPKSQKLNFLGC